MTLDELVVRVRVAVDGADGELEAALSDLRRFAQEAAAAGMSYEQLCEEIVRLSCDVKRRG